MKRYPARLRRTLFGCKMRRRTKSLFPYWVLERNLFELRTATPLAGFEPRAELGAIKSRSIRDSGPLPRYSSFIGDDTFPLLLLRFVVRWQVLNFNLERVLWTEVKSHEKAKCKPQSGV